MRSAARAAMFASDLERVYVFRLRAFVANRVGWKVARWRLHMDALRAGRCSHPSVLSTDKKMRGGFMCQRIAL